MSLAIALMLNKARRGIGVLRTIYYLPSLFGGSIAVAVLWKIMFMDKGMVNNWLKTLGVSTVSFLGDPKFALPTLRLLEVWQFGSSMVLFLAALKQVPNTLYEAAKIDGANSIKRFFSITLPGISPIIFFCIIMQTLNAMQNFTSAFVITKGGPLHSTYMLGVKLYNDGFKPLMLPNAILIIPRYTIFRDFNVLDSYYPFYLMAAFACYPFFTYMLVQFIRGIPKELDEAAYIDGCGSFGILVRILLPLLKPALFSAGLFQFLWTYNDYFNSLIYISSIKKYTVSLALRMTMDNEATTAWNSIMAMSCLVVLPVVILFFLCQKYFIEGIATTGLKG